MIARLGYFDRSFANPEQARENLVKRFKPALTSQPGCVAALWVNSPDGRKLSFSVWDSQEALEEGERRAIAVPLLPGHDPGQLPAPDRVEVWEVTDLYLSSGRDSVS